jgi:hypothetical protein
LSWRQKSEADWLAEQSASVFDFWHESLKKNTYFSRISMDIIDITEYKNKSEKGVAVCRRTER